MAQIISVFEMFPQIEEVIIYGSRAKGNYREGSDIDFTLKGNNLNLHVVNDISRRLSESSIPYRVDISVYRSIDDADLIDHIQRVGKVFYRR
ncbi:MAG: nucleotidyltransferase domain-containing protein [Ignavibacteriae bacterium]|nr:nucleotidyltransferase domain-containing protein [Ignavibacteriota bacterium]